MRIKKKNCVVLISIVAVTLVLQMFLLTGLFQYIAPSSSKPRDLVDLQSYVPKHHPRSLSHVQDSDLLSVDRPVVNTRSEQALTTKERSKDEIIAQRKRSKEGSEELEKAPKQYSSKNKEAIAHSEEDEIVRSNEVVEKAPEKAVEKAPEKIAERSPENPEKVFFEFTGVRRAIVRNNGIMAKLPTSAPTVEKEQSRTRNRLSNVEALKNDTSLTQDWEQNQLKVIKSTKKLRKILARYSAMDAYRKSLNMPAEQPLDRSMDYVEHIQALGKSSNLTLYLEEVCSGTVEPLLECSERKMRPLTVHEEQGRNIMFTLRTTKEYHDTRLGNLFETWITTLYPESLFLVTDDEDIDLAEQLENIGMHYINAKSGHSHNRTDLCCKAGVELELMFQPENEHFDWVCHVDDDMYVHVPPLAKQLSKFDPRVEPIYYGRSGSEWDSPRVVNGTKSKLGKHGQKFHFAVGGMYCLSRAMLEQAKPYLVGCKAFSDSCNQTQEPEDVTVGLITGAVLKKPLTRTEMIWSHGLVLVSATPSPFLRDQIAFSHGFGSQKPWMHLPNVVYVPGALFSIDEDITQFKSIHCHIYPTLHWCIDQKRTLVEAKRKAQKDGKKAECMCTWETYMCCEVIKAGYFQTVSAGSKALEENRDKRNGIALTKEPKVQKGRPIPRESHNAKQFVEAQLQETMQLLHKRRVPKELLRGKKKTVLSQKVEPG